MSSLKCELSDYKITDKYKNNWLMTLKLIINCWGASSACIARICNKNNGFVFEGENNFLLSFKQEELAFYFKKISKNIKPIYINSLTNDKDWEKFFKKNININSCFTSPIFWPDGSIYGIVFILDTKVNNNFEEKLKTLIYFKETVEIHLENIFAKRKNKTKEYFQKNILENIFLPIFCKDKKGNFLFVNSAWEKLIGIKSENILGKSNQKFHSVENQSKCAKSDRELLTGEENVAIYNLLIKNFNTKKNNEVIIYKNSLISENNSIIGIVGFIFDIKTAKPLYEEFLNINKTKKETKLLIAENLTEYLVKTLKKPLSLICTSTSGLMMQHELEILDDKSLGDSLNKINLTTKKLADSLEYFDTFMSQMDENKIIFDVRKKIDEFIAKEMSLKNSIKIINLSKESYFIRSSPKAVINVISQFVNKSKEALNSVVEKKEKIILFNFKILSNNLEISIIDNGPFVEKEKLDKMFLQNMNKNEEAVASGELLGVKFSIFIIRYILKGKLIISNHKFNYKNKNYSGIRYRIIFPIE